MVFLGWSCIAKTLCGMFLSASTSGHGCPYRDDLCCSVLHLNRLAKDTAFATPTSRFSMTQLFDVTQKWGQLLCPKCALDGQRPDAAACS